MQQTKFIPRINRHYPRPLVVEIPEGIPETWECFTVRPRRALSRHRRGISSERLTPKGFYKRYSRGMPA